MFLEEIGNYIAADSSLNLVVGLNLHLGFMLSDPAIGVGLLEVSGQNPERTFAGVCYEIPRLQVQVRSNSYAEARALLEKIILRLDGKGNQKFPDASGTYYLSILAIGSPVLFQRLPDEDISNLFTLMQMFEVSKKRSAA